MVTVRFIVIFAEIMADFFKMAEKDRIEKKIRIMHTTDVHGALFSHDFIENGPARGALSRVYAFVCRERERYPDALVLLDGGDVLQGQPTAYYYNFVETQSPHLVADVMNHMRYDALCIGNHDLEMGHAVYDRFVSQCRFPVLAANLVDEHTGKPYFKPYTVLERQGVRIAVLGLITSAIPHWVPKDQWRGMAVQDMVDAASRWVAYIQKHEKPDVLVGLFHSGWDGGIVTEAFSENVSCRIAHEVDGLDVICYGHDHQKHVEVVTNKVGRKVYCVGLWSLATSVSVIDVTLHYAEGRLTGKKIRARIQNVMYETDPAVYEFERKYADASALIASYVNQRIGCFERAIHSQDAYFGSSAFIDLIHDMQLKISGADVSFAAPLTFDTVIHKGDIYIRDMFHLYKYENMICVLALRGSEIKGILEMSYGLWTDRMQTPEDHIMKMAPLLDHGRRLGFVNLAFNFDSAAGIRYTVDVTRPEGERIQIESMSDGRPFHPYTVYQVVTNSYRAYGGGELFTRGAGLDHDELQRRILRISEKDIRYHFIEYIRRREHVRAEAMGHWRFVPEEWADEACRRDRAILFGNYESNDDETHCGKDC